MHFGYDTREELVPYSQDGRPIAIDTPLGADVLLLKSFAGREAISQLFRFDLELLSESESIDFTAVTGKNVTIRITLADGTERYFNGFISRFSQAGRDTKFTSYRAEFVPWLWFLTRTADCRIFQNKATPDIIQQIFTEMGFMDVSLQLYGTYAPREYCVQYRETSFNFVSRLMEEEGIFYFFQHENGKHTLVLADDPSANKPCPGQATARMDVSDSAQLDEDVVLEWGMRSEVRPGKYSHTDYNFETPGTSLAANVSGATPYEVYDYPGVHKTADDGTALAKIRLQESDAEYMVASGATNCRAFASGCRFTLQEHYRGSLNQEYLMTSVYHSASQGADYRSGGDDDFHYRNSVECIPYLVPFRPTRVTPHPVIQGTQTAFVVGPSGEEIYTDQYGRIKVQFHWDREGQNNDSSSCWVRVSYPWAGKGWGMIAIPRIGQEVIVDFLEGNPDRPLVTGSLYNADQTVPYALPDEMTKSTTKTYSSKGGGGFNEIRFEDKKGSEQVFIHAEKNMDNRVKADYFQTILGKKHLMVTGDQLEKVGGDLHLQVAGDQNEKITGTVSMQAGQDIQHKAGQNYALQSGTSIHLNAGMNLVIESGTALTLKVGSNFININSSGIAITGTMVMINSGGAAGSGPGCSPQSPSDPTEADDAQPGQSAAPPPTLSVTRTKTVNTPTVFSPAALVLQQAAQSGAPFCDI